MDDPHELLAHYSTADEQSRLTATGSLELLRTRVILERVLPPAPSRILDVGGGAGVHASWLADRDHSVHLVDPVPRHVEQASGVGTFTAALGDAVSLDQGDASYDAVLCWVPSTTSSTGPTGSAHCARHTASPDPVRPSSSPLRDYAEDWDDGLHGAPDHAGYGAVVELDELSDDRELRGWLLADAPTG